jgi:putative hydrolase of the HAD superfamily
MTSNAIRAVFWDFGGVVTTSPFDAFRVYEERNALPAGFIRAVNARDPDRNAWAKLERSEVEVPEFCRLFEAESAAAGHRVPGEDVLDLLGGEVREEMAGALRRLKPRYKLACLTNNVRKGEGPGMAGSKARAARIAEVMALFDAVIESSRVGVRKPEPRFYELACARLGVEPAEVVFLDDLGLNLKPARAMGMTTIKVVEPGQALAELEAAVGMRLR